MKVKKIRMKKKLKKKYNEEEKRHDKVYEKENTLHEKRHRSELEEAFKIGPEKNIKKIRH